ncbi:ANL_collapsed_G0027550.mRNA.1.CDS.1 [Saccharomyces cerevisiae]|nr:ANL_collapsed_G0027550.mRNA.1.CDS.1 [Saccharomyces cerevisiae]
MVGGTWSIREVTWYAKKGSSTSAGVIKFIHEAAEQRTESWFSSTKQTVKIVCTMEIENESTYRPALFLQAGNQAMKGTVAYLGEILFAAAPA